MDRRRISGTLNNQPAVTSWYCRPGFFRTPWHISLEAPRRDGDLAMSGGTINYIVPIKSSQRPSMKSGYCFSFALIAYYDSIAAYATLRCYGGTFSSKATNVTTEKQMELKLTSSPPPPALPPPVYCSLEQEVSVHQEGGVRIARNRVESVRCIWRLRRDCTTVGAMRLD